MMEMDVATPLYMKVGQWALMVAVVLATGWLWVSWRNGWISFGPAPASTGMSDTTASQPTHGDVLGSLTQPNTSPQPVSADVLKSLTPPKKNTTGLTVTTSVLDSLTPPKK